MDRTPPAPQRRALGDFVRAHRERLPPAAVGLQPGARRRTPGLRREEVAQLCGISPTWYTWIEQGRDVSVSAEALARLAATLRLSPAERAYLFELAGKRDPDRPPEVGAMDAPPAVVAAVEAVRTPAYLLDRAWNARAWNARAARLFVGWLEGPGDRNLLRYVFLHPAARALVPDWEERARRLLAEFRADTGRHLDDAEVRALVEELQRRSPEFARAWAAQAVVAREGGARTFQHPKDGLVRYEQLSFDLAYRPELKLVVLVPAQRPPPGAATRRSTRRR